ncbi:hemerythrin domain-containing protein [Actinophytocola sp.]|uniref:hemerythrin domain-containing protein n=1 Tax=Actinophytocola sp. TaxID=1872138 RepID=UPI003D6BF630
MTEPEQQDLVDTVIADHRAMTALFDDVEASGDARHRRELVERVIVALVGHSVAEERYLYPTARRVLPDGDEVVEHQLTAHADAERVMRDLSRTDPADPEFARLVHSLIDDVRHHIRAEEGDLLPRLRDACDAAELGELGRKFEQSKRLAPTRPHPAAPNQPPANTILGPGMGLIDRVRDAMTGRTT